MTTNPDSSLPIHTPRLTIRPLHIGDVESMHAIYSDAEATQFIPGGIRDYTGTRQRVTELIDHQDRHGVSKWAVILTESGRLIGDCGLQFLPERTDLELGFHFARRYWGHGYATEAAQACLAWARVNRSERILAIVDPKHFASQRVLTKVGMRGVGSLQIIGRDWLLYEAQSVTTKGC